MVLYIFSDLFFIAMSSDCCDKISFGPKLSSPKKLFYFWTFQEYLLGSYRLDYCNDLRWSILRRALNKKMDMILICSYLKKMDIVIAIFDLQANIPQMLLNSFTEDRPTIFCRTDKVIDKIAYVMRKIYISAFIHIIM